MLVDFPFRIPFLFAGPSSFSLCPRRICPGPGRILGVSWSCFRALKEQNKHGEYLAMAQWLRVPNDPNDPQEWLYLDY